MRNYENQINGNDLVNKLVKGSLGLGSGVLRGKIVLVFLILLLGCLVYFHFYIECKCNLHANLQTENHSQSVRQHTITGSFWAAYVLRLDYVKLAGQQLIQCSSS